MSIAEYKEKLQQPLRQATLGFLVREGEILLAMKKRGFGEGKWNGSGGKPEPGELIEDTAVREINEEIRVTPKSLQRMGTIRFYIPHKPEWDQEVLVYIVDEWEGEPQETEEMRPQWFSTSEIPFDEMWPDDKHWLPLVLGGKKITAEFIFDEEMKVKEFVLQEGL